MPRYTHADRAADLKEFLYDYPIDTWFTQGFLAAEIGLVPGSSGFQHVIRILRVLASVDGLWVQYPTWEDNPRRDGQVKLTHDGDEITKNLEHINATRHGVEAEHRL